MVYYFLSKINRASSSYSWRRESSMSSTTVHSLKYLCTLCTSTHFQSWCYSSTSISKPTSRVPHRNPSKMTGSSKTEVPRMEKLQLVPRTEMFLPVSKMEKFLPKEILKRLTSFVIIIFCFEWSEWQIYNASREKMLTYARDLNFSFEFKIFCKMCIKACDGALSYICPLCNLSLLYALSVSLQVMRVCVNIYVTSICWIVCCRGISINRISQCWWSVQMNVSLSLLIFFFVFCFLHF